MDGGKVGKGGSVAPAQGTQRPHEKSHVPSPAKKHPLLYSYFSTCAPARPGLSTGPGMHALAWRPCAPAQPALATPRSCRQRVMGAPCRHMGPLVLCRHMDDLLNRLSAVLPQVTCGCSWWMQAAGRASSWQPS